MKNNSTWKVMRKLGIAPWRIILSLIIELLLAPFVAVTLVIILHNQYDFEDGDAFLVYAANTWIGKLESFIWNCDFYDICIELMDYEWD